MSEQRTTQPDWLEAAAALETKLGYHFKNRELYIEALTHSTYSYEHPTGHHPCNERLEFLGDSVLGLTVCGYLYHHLPDEPEGVLSKLKARLVCEQTLARVAADLSLSSVLLLGRGEESSGGSHKASNLANAVEALYGAILCDSDFATASKVVEATLLPYIRLAREGKLVYDYKSLLLERIQTKHHSSQLQFKLLRETGPAHAPEFTVGIYLMDHFLASHTGSSKKEAEQGAARLALEVLERKHVP